MMWLKQAKVKVGETLNSSVIMADAECTQVCVYMSLVLLLASGIFELTKISSVDVFGSLALAYLSFSEARECFRNARNNNAEGINPE
jgi:divalent metal cation (Fe/Co/Zn/Cd) transporter